jgi:hypothetical protein
MSSFQKAAEALLSETLRSTLRIQLERYPSPYGPRVDDQNSVYYPISDISELKSILLDLGFEDNGYIGDKTINEFTWFPNSNEIIIEQTGAFDGEVATNFEKWGRPITNPSIIDTFAMFGINIFEQQVFKTMGQITDLYGPPIMNREVEISIFKSGPLELYISTWSSAPDNIGLAEIYAIIREHEYLDIGSVCRNMEIIRTGSLKSNLIYTIEDKHSLIMWLNEFIVQPVTPYCKQQTEKDVFDHWVQTTPNGVKRVAGTDIDIPHRDPIHYRRGERGRPNNEMDYIAARPGVRKVNSGLFCKPRNIAFSDLVGGGIINNVFTNYIINHKVDGARKILVITPEREGLSQLWFVGDDENASLISDTIDPSLSSTILDGELVPAEKRTYQPDTVDFFIVFDCFMAQGRDVSSMDLITRRHHALLIIQRINIDPELLILNLTFSEPPFVNAEGFFNVVRKMIESQKDLPYETDGLIIVPVGAVYNPRNELIDFARNNKLTIEPDICKWKPPSKMTIDFQIRRDDGDGVMKPKLYVRAGKEYKVFTGSDRYPFDNNNIRLISEDGRIDLMKISNRSIVEMIFIEGKFVPVRERYEKTDPNSIRVAQGVWDDINDPISEDVITGRTTVFATKYMDRIRSLLIKKVSIMYQKLRRTLTDEYPESSVILMDINPIVKTGDCAAKWLKLKHVYVIEIDIDKVNHIEKRVNDLGIASKVTFIQLYATDTSRIKEKIVASGHGFPTVVSIFNNFHRFYTSEEKINKLMETIHLTGTNGYLIFIAPVVDNIEALVNKKQVERPEDGIILNDVIVNIIPSSKLSILDLENDGDADIGLPVKILDWSKKYGLETLQVNNAAEERFMSSDEKDYCSMFKYGIAQIYRLHTQKIKEEDTATIISPAAPQSEIKPRSGAFMQPSNIDIIKSRVLMSQYIPPPPSIKIEPEGVLPSLSVTNLKQTDAVSVSHMSKSKIIPAPTLTTSHPAPDSSSQTVIRPVSTSARPIIPVPVSVQIPTPIPASVRPIIPTPIPASVRPIIPAPIPASVRPIIPTPIPVSVRPSIPTPIPVSVRPSIPTPIPTSVRPSIPVPTSVRPIIPTAVPVIRPPTQQNTNSTGGPPKPVVIPR